MAYRARAKRRSLRRRNRLVGAGCLGANPHAVLPRRLPDLETDADTAFDPIHSIGITLAPANR